MTTNTPRHPRDEQVEPLEPLAADATTAPAIPAGVDVDAHTLVAKGPDVPEAAEGALKVEGITSTGEEGAGGDTGTVRALLFAPKAEPREVPLSDTPALTQQERNFVWVELLAYTAADLRQVADVVQLPAAAVVTTLGA